jgi:hypothetical protein
MHAVELHACATELASLHNRCSSKQASGGASCDTVQLTSCPCRYRPLCQHRAPQRQTSIRPSSHVTLCRKLMFQVFQMFWRYVANVLYLCCKSRLGCYTCCNGVSRVCLNISSVSDICCKCFIFAYTCMLRMFQVFHLDIAYVCNCYTYVFHVF